MVDKDEYIILESPVKDFGYIILSKSYISITDYIPFITDDLKHLNFKGNVIFDYLLSSGSLKERFFSLIFNGEGFDFDTFKSVSNIDKSIENLANFYYNKHYNELIRDSILSLPSKFIIKKKAGVNY